MLIHFDSSNGLVYEERPKRQKRTTDRQEWWDARTELFRKYVLPSLLNQSLEDFDVWGMFDPRDKQRSEEMMALFGDNRFIHTNIGVRGLFQYYEDFKSPICIVHLDSDDMYARGAMRMFKEANLKPGQIAYCDTGYLLDTESQELSLYQGVSTPPPFFAMVYPPKAFSNQKVWDNFRSKAGFVTFHQRLSHHKHSRVMSPWMFCHTINGHNTQILLSGVRSRIDYRTKGTVTNSERRQEILTSFGLN